MFLEGVVMTMSTPVFSFDIKPFIFISVLNSFILIFFNRILLQKNHIYVLLYILISGLFLISNHEAEFVKQFVAIMFVSIYFYSCFRYVGAQELFSVYVRYAYYYAIFSIIYYYEQLLYGHSFGVHGLMAEPSVYAIFMMPAFYYFLREKVEHRKRILLVIGGGILLSGSSMGYLGMVISLFLVNTISIKSWFKGLSLLVASFILFYSISSDFSSRINSTFDALNSGSLPAVNTESLSTFALMSNYFVAMNVLKENPILGNGLGSHSKSHEKYFSSISGSGPWSEAGLDWMNKSDANSLGIRIASEFGIIGIMLVALFLWSNLKKVNYENRGIIIGAFIYLILVIIRSGNYVAADLHFFIFMIYFIGQRKQPISRKEC
jgi:hypothetical protein